MLIQKRTWTKYFWLVVSLLFLSSASYLFFTTQVDVPSTLIISEFVAGNDFRPVDEDGDNSDWIEIHNQSNRAINLSGWTLTDDPNRPEKWSFPNMTLESKGYLIVFASGKNRKGSELHTNFKLSKTDNFLGLYNILDGDFQDEIALQSFGYFREISYGYSDEGYGYFTEPTPGEPNLTQRIDPGINAAVPLFAEETPQQPEFATISSRETVETEANVQLQISELMYNPPGGSDYEFIELKNVGDTSFDISGAHFAQGIEFTFRYGPPIAPGDVIVLANNPKTFEERYPDVDLSGIYDGNLSNKGETIVLNDLHDNPLVIVTYNDENGWPLTPDGEGDSLEYIASSNDVTDPRNWRASRQIYGSPGVDSYPSDNLVYLDSVEQRLQNYLNRIEDLFSGG